MSYIKDYYRLADSNDLKINVSFAGILKLKITFFKKWYQIFFPFSFFINHRIKKFKLEACEIKELPLHIVYEEKINL